MYRISAEDAQARLAISRFCYYEGGVVAGGFGDGPGGTLGWNRISRWRALTAGGATGGTGCGHAGSGRRRGQRAALEAAPRRAAERRPRR